MVNDVRLWHRAAVSALTNSDFYRLRDLQRIIDFNAQVTNRAFQFLMAQQELDHTKILSFLVD